MNGKFRHSIYLSILICFTSCSDKIENEFTDDYEVPVILPLGNEAYLEGDSDYIFDQNELRTYELKLPQSALARLDNDPAAEEYVEGSLIFEGDTISPVGIRYKGSIGGFVNCVSGSDWTNPTGRKTCTKLSMKVNINWEGREDKFYKLRKLQFHSQNLDDSQMRERLGYWLFREIGVKAPRSVHARLKINGVYAGLFALTEQIDGRFVKYNFKDDDGNLYKEVWPLDMDGNPHSASTYRNALKTNEGATTDVSIIETFATQLSEASIEEGKGIVETHMDIDELMAHIVVDRTIRHDDGPFHWYCSGNDCSPHNFYIYEEPNSRKLYLIPWDLDNAFENIISNSNPVTPILDDWGEVSNNCEPFSESFFGIKQWSAACDKLTAIWTSYEAEFDEKKAELINGPLSESVTNEMIDRWSDQIRASTEEARELHDDAVRLEDWEKSIMELKEQLDFARNN